MTLLAQVGVLLAATVIAIPLFRRFRLSSVLGYLAAGIAIGPWSLRLVTDTDGVRDIAEFGVVLLLFVIGLELQPSRLHAMRRAIFGLGLLQVVVTSIAFAVIGMAFGLSSSTAAVVGFALSLSSTPLVLQLLAEREQLNTHHGRSSFGILLFQDIAVMPMLAILPMLGTNGGVDRLSQTWPSIVKGLAVLAVLIFGGRLLLRPVLRMVANTKVREAFTAAALLVVIGTSLLVSAVGLSMALGAFVAGLLLADSEYRHELEADIEPFKGLLLGLFFISVGMTANLGLIVERPLTVVALVVGLIAIKSVLLWVLGRATGHSGEGVRGLAFALPQAGEFGFVIFALAVRLAIMDQPLADLLVIVVTASMIVSPLLMNLQYAVLEPLFKKEKAREYDRIDAAEPRVIVSGVGRFGQIVCRVLRMRRIPFTALEADAEQIETLRRYGSKVYYGDASRLELLQAARADRAELFILAISDVEASIRTVETLNKHFPNLKILARARNRQHALRLMELGVRYIVRETYFSGLELAQQTLETLGLTRADAEDSIRKFRTIDEKALRAQLEFKDDEQKLIQNAQLVAKELERLFESDTELTEDQPQVTARPVTS
jgi:glutathione-regulated potassium-efflux system ancillary protein KefC/glutathione-regulated potassium-efflux system protein KefB